MVAVEIDLVCAHDAHHSRYSRGIGIAHGRSEECPRRRLPRSRSFRVHHFRGFDSLGEKANPPIALPQPPLAVLIVGVFTPIAVTGSPRHHLRHGRAFPGKQKPELFLETLQPARSYVVLAWRRGLVRFRFSGKPFSHFVIPNPDGKAASRLICSPVMGWWNLRYWACRKYPPSPGRPGRFSRGWPVKPYRGSPERRACTLSPCFSHRLPPTHAR